MSAAGVLSAIRRDLHGLRYVLGSGAFACTDALLQELSLHTVSPSATRAPSTSTQLGFSSSTAALKNGSPPPVHRSASEVPRPGVPRPPALHLIRCALQKPTRLCRLRKIYHATDRSILLKPHAVWRSVQLVLFGSAPLSRSGNASPRSTDSVWPILSSRQVSPAYLWPINSHLSSVPNLVGQDTQSVSSARRAVVCTHAIAAST